MKIAICDGSLQDLEQLKSLLFSCVKNYGSIEIYPYTSGEQILEDYTKRGFRFEMVFLETQLPRMNGLETAGQIMKHHPGTLLFFVTASQEYVFAGYEVRAFRYILKPYSSEELKRHFLVALMELQDEEKRYSIHTKAAILTYNPDDILFLESDRRQVFATTLKERVGFYSKLSVEEEKLKGFGFVRVHQGYLVNMAHIKTIIDNTVILTNDMQLPISKSKKKEALNQYTNYLTEFTGILR